MKAAAVVNSVLALTAIMTVFSGPSLASRDVPIRVACVGDSITQNCGYPSDLQSLLGANYTVGNFGSSGSTVLLNYWHPYMDQPAYMEALEFQPDIVVIMLGTNDDLQSLRPYNESFQEDYTNLIAPFQHLESKPQIFIATPPPIFSNSSDLSSAYLTETLIPKIEDLANKLNLPIIDVNGAFGNHAEYFQDGVHPNSQGATIIASEVYDAIVSQHNSA